VREAIGNTFIVNLLLVFIAVISALLIGSIAYSRAFRVKNRIIHVIEKYGAWDVRNPGGGSGTHEQFGNIGAEFTDNIVQMEIERSLQEIGYHLNLWDVRCPDRCPPGPECLVYGRPQSGGLNASGERWSAYDFCVYRFEGGRYYGVVTFMHFNIPLLGGFLRFPVYGETKPLLNLTQERFQN